jgi:hypothetical protein
MSIPQAVVVFATLLLAGSSRAQEPAPTPPPTLAPTPALTSTPENTPEACRDGKDNDGDSYLDCTDQDCGLFVFCSSAPRPGPAAAATEAAPTVAKTETLPGSLTFLSGGTRSIDFFGGNVSLQFAFGHDGKYAIVGAHFAGGSDFEGLVPSVYLVPSAELGFRWLGSLPGGMRPTAWIAAAAGTIFETEGGDYYRYLFPHGRWGLGVLWGSGRGGFGAEIVGLLGYGLQIDSNTTGNYSGTWGGLEVNLVVTF